MKIAVLGYGTIGSGVVEIVNTNAATIAKRAGEEIEVKYVLDLRDFPGDEQLLAAGGAEGAGRRRAHVCAAADGGRQARGRGRLQPERLLSGLSQRGCAAGAVWRGV